MANIDLALVICNPGEDREKVAAALRKCGVRPGTRFNCFGVWLR